jgi:SAM-dependent methyltransferase
LNNNTLPYTKLARYYDIIYSKRVNYGAQADYLEQIFDAHGKVDSILDVACGTGNYTFIFAKRGYKTTGIDISREMIEVAKSKAHSKSNPRFFTIDMRDIKLRDEYDAVTVLFGGFGYLLKLSEVERFLRGAKKRLRNDGLLIFEFLQNSGIDPAASTPSGRPRADRADDGKTLVIRFHLSRFDPLTNIHSLNLDHYIIDLKTKSLADTFSETHYVRTYSLPHMTDLLERNGFNIRAFYNGDVGNEKTKLVNALPSTYRVIAAAQSRP